MQFLGEGIPHEKGADITMYKQLIMYACEIDYPVFNKKLTSCAYLNLAVKYSTYFAGKKGFVTYLFGRLFSEYGILSADPTVSGLSAHLVLAVCNKL